MTVTTSRHLPRVLVVDDEKIIADTLTMILSISEYDARAAYSGEMAIEMARNFLPEMLITDVVMPGISGIETAIKLREMAPDCKVLLFSGQATSPAMVEAARAQDHHFELLAKPVHPSDLLARLRRGLTT
jgi:DNA-binding NtrC family response regulator